MNPLLTYDPTAEQVLDALLREIMTGSTVIHFEKDLAAIQKIDEELAVSKWHSLDIFPATRQGLTDALAFAGLQIGE